MGAGMSEDGAVANRELARQMSDLKQDVANVRADLRELRDAILGDVKPGSAPGMIQRLLALESKIINQEQRIAELEEWEQQNRSKWDRAYGIAAGLGAVGGSGISLLLNALFNQ